RACVVRALQHSRRRGRARPGPAQGPGGARLMSDLREIYGELILEHAKRPRNFRKIEGEVRKAEGLNPLCGDRVKVYLQMEGEVVKDGSFGGSGCAIATASASLMTESLKGKTRAEVVALFDSFRDLVTGAEPQPPAASRLGKLMALSGVCAYPVRVKCATLA